MTTAAAWPLHDREPPEPPEPPELEDPDQRAFHALGAGLRRSQLGSLPRVHDLVDGVLSEPAAVVLVGAYGTGKSILVHGLAGAIATGDPWLGRKVEQRRALVVVGEGAYGLDDRIAAWETAWREGRPIPDEVLEFRIKPGSLRERNTWQQLTEYALAGGFRFIVLDTFSSLAPDIDETKESAQVMRRLSDLSAAIEGTVILVHHPGWSDSSRVRGGYQLEANADEVLVLTGITDSDLVCLTRKKVKDGVNGATLWMRRRPFAASVILEHARSSDVEVPLRQRILATLEGYGDTGATGPQLITECEVDERSKSGFYKAMRTLTGEQIVKSVGARTRLRYYLTAHAPGEQS